MLVIFPRYHIRSIPQNQEIEEREREKIGTQDRCREREKKRERYKFLRFPEYFSPHFSSSVYLSVSTTELQPLALDYIERRCFFRAYLEKLGFCCLDGSGGSVKGIRDLSLFLVSVLFCTLNLISARNFCSYMALFW